MLIRLRLRRCGSGVSEAAHDASVDTECRGAVIIEAWRTGSLIESRRRLSATARWLVQSFQTISR